MSEYEVRDVVCDYGVYEDGELKLILNSRRIALQIVELLKEDDRKHKVLNYPPYLDRPKGTIYCKDCKHLMFSDFYGECNKRLILVNPRDTCSLAERKEK